MPNLILRAPLRGWSAPIDETPDAVFAQRLLGDGVAIDPTGDTLHAPCDGEVISVPASRHAVAIRADNGAEILMHVGIDTVALGGEGFRALVQVGARVKSGEALLKFDLDVLAKGARSLVTPIVVTNGEQHSIVRCVHGRTVEVGEVLIELQATSTGAAAARSGVAETSETFAMTLEHGLHARPAAMIAGFAKTVAGEISRAFAISSIDRPPK